MKHFRSAQITLTMNQLSTTNNFSPWLRLYGPNGVLIADSGINNGGAVTAQINQFGVLNITNLYNPSVPRQFFRLVLP